MKKDQFSLKSVKLDKKSVTAKYLESKQVDGKLKNVTHDITAPYVPHPDLVNAMGSLKTYLAQAYQVDKGGEIDIEVTKISIGGLDTAQGVVITGKQKSFNGSMVSMNTPRIVYNSDKIGFEKEVETKIDTVIEETYKCLFKSKHAQLAMFNDDEDEPQGKDAASGEGVKDKDVVDPETVKKGKER